MQVSVSFLLFLVFLTGSDAQPDPQGIGDEDPETVYNRTYSEHHTLLEKTLFKGYNANMRPVKNESLPLEVNMWWQISHISINEEQQTMTVHGNVYMTWVDELLGWDIDEYNGIRTIKTSKYQVWHPKLIVANSVSGVNAQYEVSSQAHVIIGSHGKETGSQMELYPTFSIKVGCSLDFAAFPYDEHICSMAILPNGRMSEVKFKVFHDLRPSVKVDWADGGSATPKVTMSGFLFKNATNDIIYYKEGSNVTNYEPITSNDETNTWSVMRVTISFKRNSGPYFYTTLLPCFISILVTLTAFLPTSVSAAVYVQLSNVLIQVFFLQEMIGDMPMSVSRLPRVVILSTAIMIINTLSLCFHILILILLDQEKAPAPILRIVYLLDPLKKVRKTDSEEHSWLKLTSQLRQTGFIFVTATFVICCFIYSVQTLLS